MTDRCIGLEAWIERISQAELPALAAVVQDLNHLASGSNASVQQLAEVLLRDAALTSKVLRVANSAYFNPQQDSIKTISRAIILIGFDNVRQIALSVSLIDSLLGRQPREQLLELLARSFHAAVQARNICGYVQPRYQEEVFIAALLHHLGEMAFWGCAGSQSDELSHALQQPGANSEQVVQQLLGTSFRQLTLGLMKSWNLGETACLALASGGVHDPLVRSVRLGVEISAAALQGWDSAPLQSLLDQMSGFTGTTPEEALQQVLASADEAVKVASTFGAPSLGRLIPNTDPELIRLQQEERQARLLQPDLLVLQQCLQDLALLANSKSDVNLVLDTLLKGLHQGAGLERVMVSVLAEGQCCFRVRRAIGAQSEDWSRDFVLPAHSPEQPHLFSYVLKSKESLWMGVPASYSLNDLVTQPMRHWLGNGMFFIAALMAGTREIGVVYADCRVSSRALRHEQFVAFQRFVQATGRCLEAMAQRK